MKKITSCFLALMFIFSITACTPKPNTLVIKGTIEEVFDSRFTINNITGLEQKPIVVDKATIKYDDYCEIQGEIAKNKDVELTILADINISIYPAAGKAVKIIVK